MLQTVATATNNRKDNHLFALFRLLASFSRVSLVKTISDNTLFAKNKNLSRGFLKSYNFLFLIEKKKKSLDKIVSKIVL